MKRIYCLSGLGADHRIFGNISLPGAELVHLPWAGHDKHDELPCYAQKMSALIPEESPDLLGVSFGGMLATEISKIRPVGKVAVVSSAKSGSEVPQLGNFLRFIIGHNMVPAALYKVPSEPLYERFGAATGEEKALLKSILHESDAHLVKWAFKAISEWRGERPSTPVLHIHGTADRILPVAGTTEDVTWIEGGTHMMVYNRAAEINPLLAAHFA